MTISKDHKNQLRSLGFKFYNKKKFSYVTPYNQYLLINVSVNGFQMEIDGIRIHSQELSFDDLLTIILLLYPDEKR